MLNLNLEESSLLELIKEQGKRLDVVGVCTEHKALLSLRDKGLIKTDSELIPYKIIYWVLV